MKRIPRGIYTQEFLAQAVSLHEADGLTISEAARRLSLPPGTLKNWIHAARLGKLDDVGKNQKPLTELEIEIRAAHQRTRETFGPERNFTVTAPNRVWVSDITYISTGEGWLYLAGLKDLFSGELVGYAMSERMTKNLVMQALFRGVSARRPAKGLILHSDRGSQYCAQDYQKLLRQFGMTASMSRKGDCWDNAPMESFWGTLKNELIHHRRYRTRAQAIQEITEYIEIFYNRQRKQVCLGYLSPAAFMRQYYEKLFAA